MKRLKATGVGAVLALVMTLAACGDGGATSSTAKPSNGNLTGAPIVVGVLSSVGGPIFNSPDSLAAVNAAVASINNNGGIKGRPLEVKWCNEANDPNKAEACARELVDDKVVMTLSSEAVSAGPIVTQIFTKANLANIGWVAALPEQMQTANNFPLTNIAMYLASGAAHLADVAGVKKVLTAVPDSGDVSDVYEQTKAAAGANGFQIADKEVIIPRQVPADWTPLAQQVIDSGADLVITAVSGPRALPLIQAVRQLGGKQKFLAMYQVFSDADIATLGGDPDIYEVSPTAWVNDVDTVPGIKPFVDAMNEAAKAGDQQADLAIAKPQAAMAWGGVHMAADVLGQMADKGTEINAENFLAAFSSASDLDTGGVAGTWSPTFKFPLAGYEKINVKDLYILTSASGKLKVLDPKPFDATQYLPKP